MQVVAVLAFIGVLALCSGAHAWKPKTHMYVANVIMADALDNGKVWIPPFGEFSVDPAVLAAIRANPDQFRAGSIGPDWSPDLWTGQMYIHSSTDPWLQHLYRSVNTSQGAAGRAYVYGYFLHCAGDMWAHDWVNYYAGGPWPTLSELSGDPSKVTRIVCHLAFETSFDNRVAVGARTVSIPKDFVYNYMVLDPGAKAAGMNPIIQHYVDLYWQKWPKRNDTTVGIETYDARWFDDLDEGLRAYVDATETSMKQAFESPNGDMIGSLSSNYGDWASIHILDMEGAPSATKAIPGVLSVLSDAVKAALAATGLAAVIEDIQNAFVDFMLQKTMNMTKAQLKQYLTQEANASLLGANYNQAMPEIGTIPPESAWVHSNSDHAKFQQFLTSTNGALYNSVIAGKIALLAPGELYRLYGKGNPNAAGITAYLGQLRTIDGSDQFRTGVSGAGLRNFLGCDVVSVDPNQKSPFPYIFKPYLPADKGDRTLWTQRGPGKNWKDGYYAYIDGKMVDPKKPGYSIGVVNSMLFCRRADQPKGPWGVVFTGPYGYVRTQMAIEVGKTYILRPVHSEMNYSDGTKVTFGSPIDLFVQGDFTGTPVSGYYNPDRGTDSSPKTLTIDPAKPDQATAPFLAPTSQLSGMSFDLSAFGGRDVAIRTNTLGMICNIPVVVTKCRKTGGGSDPGDMWLTGMTGTLGPVWEPGMLSGPAIKFTVDMNGNAVWGMESLKSVSQAAKSGSPNPNPGYMQIQMGSHPGIVKFQVGMDSGGEAGARMAYGYRKVQASLNALPAADRATQPYQSLATALDNLPNLIDSAASAETALRAAIDLIPDAQHKSSLTQALNNALALWPDPAPTSQGQGDPMTALLDAVYIDQYGNIKVRAASSSAGANEARRTFSYIVHPNPDGPDSNDESIGYRTFDGRPLAIHEIKPKSGTGIITPKTPAVLKPSVVPARP
jgi:hypothetical protein